MKYHLITDTHFNHEKVKEFCGRPDDYEKLLFSSMRQVPVQDTLIHLGDICIGKDLEVHQKYIESLKCKKWLVKGNHDRKTDSWYYEHGWDVVVDGLVLRHMGKEILFTHTPRPISNFDYNIHGHFHNGDHRMFDPGKHARYRPEDLGSQHILLAVEYTNYKTITIEKLLIGD